VNIGAFDLNLLIVFDALLTDRSVTRAARRLGLSQPALSNALSRLRDGVGDRLFERSRDGMQPTARAMAMAVPVRTALKAFDRALAKPQTSRLPERRVTIGANSYAQCVLLPRVIRLLKESASGVTLDVRSPSSAEAALTVDWTSNLASNAASSAVVIRDPLVCVTREPTKSADRVGLEGHGRHRARQRLNNEDFMGAVCLALQSEVVATTPRRLAEWFAKRVSLRISKPPEKLPDAVLRVSLSDPDGDDPDVIATRLCVLEAGAWLAQGSRK
jgi:hypothetical protein